jgi:hypothetical protein
VTYEWIAVDKLKTEDGRTLEIIRNDSRSSVVPVKRWYIREVTATQIRNHHFPEISSFGGIVKEAVRIAEVTP